MTIFPQKVWLRGRSGLLYFAVTTSCCVSERYEKGYKSSQYRSPLKLRENNGLMQFVQTKKTEEFTIVAGTKVCSLHFTLEDLRKII